jgi:hypothetical protein
MQTIASARADFNSFWSTLPIIDDGGAFGFAAKIHGVGV